MLTSVKYHGNLYILVPLNQRLALTRLRATGKLCSVIAFEKGECLLFVYRTRISNHSVCHAISRFGRHLGPAWHTLMYLLCLDLMFSVVLALELILVFCDTRSQMKLWRFSAADFLFTMHRFVYSFSRCFQLRFFITGKFPFKDNRICKYYVC